MKKLILLTALLSAPSMAEDFCLQMHNVGKTIMGSRQNGVPLPQLMGLINESEESLRDPLKEITVEAYSQPRYNSKEMQKKAISEFANDLYVQCLKSV